MEEELPKKTKGKKRPSDFEIVRTILQRTHERKLPYILKNMGEDEDIIFLCSNDEEGFVYGSSDMTIAIIEITDDTLKTTMEYFFDKMHGFSKENPHQLVINLRDQISELAKTKGEMIEGELHYNSSGSVWTVKKDVNGREKIFKYCSAIDSLYHFQNVKYWNAKYRPLLTTEDPNHLYYSYSHTNPETSSILTLEKNQDDNHPLVALYPHGFRTMVTKGIDVIIDKSLEDFPYPIIKEEIIVVSNQTSDSKDVTCQIAHRLHADGWRMILVRPNMVFFPSI